MRNMKYLAIFAGITLCAAIVVLLLSANPVIAAIGSIFIAVSMMGFAATATTYVMDQCVAALALHNEDFHWQQASKARAALTPFGIRHPAI